MLLVASILFYLLFTRTQDFGRAPNEVVKGSKVLARSSEETADGQDIFRGTVESISACGTKAVVKYSEPYEDETETVPIEDVEVDLRGYKYSGTTAIVELPAESPSELAEKAAAADQPAANLRDSEEHQQATTDDDDLSQPVMNRIQAKMDEVIHQELRDAGFDPETERGKCAELSIGRAFLKRKAPKLEAQSMDDVLDDDRIQNLFLLYDLIQLNGNLGTKGGVGLMASHKAIINDSTKILGLPIDAVKRMFPCSEEDWKKGQTDADGGSEYGDRRCDRRKHWLLQFVLNVVAHFSGKCWGDCGFVFDFKGDLSQHAIEFHHLDESTKVTAMSNVSHRPSWFIIAELRKTVPICSNCHREL